MRAGLVIVDSTLGGGFPTRGPLATLDACVKLEDIFMHTRYNHECNQETKYIKVTCPVVPRANRQMAGSDMAKSEVIIRAGQLISSSHMLPLSSAGYRQIEVARRIRVGIWSTGSEYIRGDTHSLDINEPFHRAASADFGVDPEFLGYPDDNAENLLPRILRSESGRFDVLVTTGEVSVGKYDLIRSSLEICDAQIAFHGVAIRPGHPVLFGTLQQPRTRLVAFFGLPGNPEAIAACFRLLVVQYLRLLGGRGIDRGVTATVVAGSEQLMAARSWKA